MKMGMETVLESRSSASALVFGFVSATRAQSDVEKLYKAKCMGCHAADGSANTKAGKNTGVTTSVYLTWRRNRRHIDRDRFEGQEKDA